jgi:hypothetical protein
MKVFVLVHDTGWVYVLRRMRRQETNQIFSVWLLMIFLFVNVIGGLNYFRVFSIFKHKVV